MCKKEPLPPLEHWKEPDSDDLDIAVGLDHIKETVGEFADYEVNQFLKHLVDLDVLGDHNDDDDTAKLDSIVQPEFGTVWVVGLEKINDSFGDLYFWCIKTRRLFSIYHTLVQTHSLKLTYFSKCSHWLTDQCRSEEIISSSFSTLPLL